MRRDTSTPSPRPLEKIKPPVRNKAPNIREALGALRESDGLGTLPQSLASIPSLAPGERGGAGGQLPLQRKLAVGAANDPLESQADAMAERVVGEQTPATTQNTAAAPGQSAKLRRKNSGAVTAGSVAPASVTPMEAPPGVHNVLSTPGRPLDGATRSFMEPRFGHDFKNVRVHADAEAAASARSIHATAYTVGRHIVFDSERTGLGDAAGTRLMAHELSHVVQQGESPGPVRRQVSDVAQTASSDDVILGHIAGVSFTAPAFGVSATNPIWKELDPLWMVGLLHILERADQLGYLKALDDNVGQAQDIFRERLQLAIDAVKMKRQQGTVTVMDSRFEGRLKILPPQQQQEIFQYMTSSKAGAAIAIAPPVNSARANAAPLQDYLHPPPPKTNVPRNRSLEIAGMSSGDRLGEAAKRAIPQLGPETGERLKELLTPESIAMMVGFTAIYIASQATPAGWVADVIAGGLLLLTLAMVGTEMVAVVQNVVDFATIGSNAKSDADLDLAGQHLATAITKVGIDVVMAILLHKAGKAAKPYIKPPPSAAVVVDMVTPDGQVIRVPIDSVPEAKPADLQQATQSRGSGNSGGGQGGQGGQDFSVARPRRSGPPIQETVSSDRPSGSYLPFETPSTRAVTSGSPILSVDPTGRAMKAQGWMFEDPAPRTSAQSQLTGPGSPYHGLQAGHTLPAARGGPGAAAWLVPLEEHVNKSQVASIESFINNKVASGSSIYLQVYLRYVGEGKIPAELTYYVYELVNGALSLKETRIVGGEEPIFVH